MTRRGGLDGRRADPHPLDGAVHRGELGAEGLRPARLRARRRRRRGAALRRADRARGRDAVRRRAATPGSRAAIGLLATDMVYEYVSTVYQRLSKLDAAGAPARFEELEAQARGQLEADGFPADRLLSSASPTAATRAGLRAARRRRPRRVDDAWVEKLRADFHDIHQREYSRRFEESDIEVPNVRVRGIGLMPRARDARGRAGASRPRRRCAARARRGSWSTGAGAGADALLRPRPLRPGTGCGARDRQPVRLDDGDPTGHRAHVDRYGNI